MWVEGSDIHDELLDELACLLVEPEIVPAVPSDDELALLAAVVAAHFPAAGPPGPDPVGPVWGSRPPEAGERRAPQAVRSVAGREAWRRLGPSVWRAGAAAVAGVVLTASAAAAATGDPLPRPVRAVAHSVGLPIASPALVDTHDRLRELDRAVRSRDRRRARATAQRLQADFSKVPLDEKKGAKQKVEAALAAAAPLLSEPPEPAPAAATPAPAPAAHPAAGAGRDEADLHSSDPASSPSSPSTGPTIGRATTSSVPAGAQPGSETAPGETPPSTTSTPPPASQPAGTDPTTETGTADGADGGAGDPESGTTAPDGDGSAPPAAGDGASDAGTGETGGSSGGEGGETTPTTTPATTDPGGAGDGGTAETTAPSSSTTTTAPPASDPEPSPAP